MKKILDIKEVSTYLKVSVPKIRNMVRENKIPFYRVGSKLYFELDKIDQWINDLEELENERMLLY